MQVPLVMCLHADFRLDLTLGMHRGNDGDLPNGFVCTDVSVELCVGSSNQSINRLLLLGDDERGGFPALSGRLPICKTVGLVCRLAAW
jgi:hypothetical protein